MAAPSPAPTLPESRFIPVLLTLTFVTGLVDAVSFVGLGHVFTANMTGNVVFEAFALGGVPGVSGWRSAVAIAAFLLGGVLGGRLALAAPQDTQARWFRNAILVEALLLAISGGVAFGTHVHHVPDAIVYSIIVLTAIAMGLRNACVRKLAIPDFTTTVLTLTITGIAADSSAAGGKNPRWGRRVAAILLTFAGALAGTWLLQVSLMVALLGAALLSGLCLIPLSRRV